MLVRNPRRTLRPSETSKAVRRWLLDVHCHPRRIAGRARRAPVESARSSPSKGAMVDPLELGVGPADDHPSHRHPYLGITSARRRFLW